MVIKREIERYFEEWKRSRNRKPLLIQGARQIGKTWAMEHFGREHYRYCVKFDFDRSRELHDVFAETKDPERIIKELAAYSKVPLLPKDTLIIFDEIQECENALNSLKYFYEEAPQYHIMAAGSLLGVAVKRRKMTVPVGKVRMVHMYPITFAEFLHSADEDTYEYINNLDQIRLLPTMVLNKLLLEYKRYQICGGMPEAVVAMLSNEGMEAVDDILQDILDLYELDFSKYAAPIEIPRIRAIWHSLPSQLSKENRKFIYKVVREGARSKDYEDALLWLSDAGMIYQVHSISKPGIPLSGYAESNAFKAYACDCGLLRRLANVSGDVIMNGNSGYIEFKGAMAENIVLLSLMTNREIGMPYYWTSGNTAEVEFIVQYKDQAMPVEVKSAGNTSGRSLSVYNDKYNPTQLIRFSTNNLQRKDKLLNIPSPMAAWMTKLIDLK